MIYYTVADEQGVPVILGTFRQPDDARQRAAAMMKGHNFTLRRLQIVKVETRCHGYVDNKPDPGP